MAGRGCQEKSSPLCRTIQINGKLRYLWRAVDQDGEVVDVYFQTKRDGAAAKRFFKRLLRNYGGEPGMIVILGQVRLNSGAGWWREGQARFLRS